MRENYFFCTPNTSSWYYLVNLEFHFEFQRSKIAQNFKKRLYMMNKCWKLLTLLNRFSLEAVLNLRAVCVFCWLVVQLLIWLLFLEAVLRYRDNKNRNKKKFARLWQNLEQMWMKYFRNVSTDSEAFLLVLFPNCFSLVSLLCQISGEAMECSQIWLELCKIHATPLKKLFK